MVNKDILAQDLLKTIKNSGGKLLQSAKIFDVYEGNGIEENKKSIAFSVVLGSIDKTLKDEEINQTLDKIVNSLESKHGATLRK